ncbi:MAG TPA: ABC transporter substrate-binding protein [Methylomirabilota bacterium]|jgi:ABC-type transport system substrate-binding protein|nr:ABC transporter substrate-binding protein [Methylomirabilota bacterium]
MAKRGGPRPPVFVVLLLLALVAVATPVSAQERPATSAASVYRRPLGTEPATLDPARIADIYGRSVAQQIFDGLVEFDQTLTIAPALAQYWKASRDGLTWTFTLRKGARFHNGREVTADDVVFSLSRLVDPRVKSTAADLFMNIQGAQAFRDGRAATVRGLTAPDASTVRIVLDEAPVPFVTMLAIGHAKILPRDLVTQQGEAFGMTPIGTGPFRFERWDRHKEIVLAANPDYFAGPPRIGRIVYRIFPDEGAGAMFEEFRRGRLEDSPVPMQDYPKLLTSGHWVHVKRPMFSVRFLGFNTRVKPWSDPRVRQALTYGLDREAIVQESTRGRFVLARGILPPGTLGYNPRLAGYGYDPARARELLSQAGYPEGRGLTPLTVCATVKLEPEHPLMTRYLATIGVKTEFRYVSDWTQFQKLLTDGQCPSFQYAWFADVPEPDNFLNKLFHSRSPRNYTGYANAQLDEILMRARTDRDDPRRVELYRRAEQMVLDDAVVIPFFHYTYERVFQPYVKSIEVSGLGDPYIPFRKIWLETGR